MRRRLSLVTALVLVTIGSLPVQAHAGSDRKANEMAGAILFRDKGCAHCHGAGGIGTKKAPPLIGIRKNKAWPPEKLKDQILNGGKKMPPFADSLTDEDVAQIIAYLRAKHLPIPPPAPSTAD
ncbi:MAG: cytochrome c [Terracidiphilus sp.]